MREKPYTEIESVAQELVQAVVKQTGEPPDNFVESAEGTTVGLPDLDADPDAQLVIKALDERIEAALKNSNGSSTMPNTKERA